MNKLLKSVLIFQGFYYSLTALWAIFALDHFARVTGLHPESLNTVGRFEMYSIAGMSLVLGIFFIFASRQRKLLWPVAWLVLGIALSVAVVELIFLPQIGNPPLFWLDFAEESIIGLLLIISFLSSKTILKHGFDKRDV